MYRFDHMCYKVTLILENLVSLSPVSFGTTPKCVEMWIVGGVASEQFLWDSLMRVRLCTGHEEPHVLQKSTTGGAV